MIHRRVACSFAVACVVALGGHSAKSEPRAVIELFTSQGCSSCPAADKLLAEYAHDRSVVALTLAVDYWDYLGWKDTLALARHTKRQRAYAKARGDRQVYTPQAVVNGTVHALGSDPSAIERAITQTRASGKAMVLPVSLASTGDKITVNVPAAMSGSVQGEVWLCPIAKSVSVVIKRGENKGRTVTYSNVVRGWIKLGDWTGQAQAFDVALTDFQHADIDAVVVVVQSGIASAPRQMLGAAQVALRK